MSLTASVSINAKRRSGESHTSICNGLVNVQIQLVAMQVAFQIPLIITKKLFCIEGGDDVAFLYR